MCIYSPMPHTLSYCALIGKCALIRSNTVFILLSDGGLSTSSMALTLLHPEWPKLYGVLAILSAKGLNQSSVTFPDNSKYLDLPYKMCLDIWDCF